MALFDLKKTLNLSLESLKNRHYQLYQLSLIITYQALCLFNIQPYLIKFPNYLSDQIDLQFLKNIEI